MTPAWITSTARRNPGSALPWLPIWVARFFSLARLRTVRASKTVCTRGFWQKQCFPIFIARMAAGPWLWSGVETVTASMLLPMSSSIFR